MAQSGQDARNKGGHGHSAGNSPRWLNQQRKIDGGATSQRNGQP
jgi:hypothetical protein